MGGGKKESVDKVKYFFSSDACEQLNHLIAICTNHLISICTKHVNK